MFHLPLLNDELLFPPPENAHSSGLLAAGGDLSIHRLILAYSSGIFPWFDASDPFLWWSPDPRFVMFTKNFKLSARQERAIKHANFHITANTAFNSVVKYCAQVPRKKNAPLEHDDNAAEQYDNTPENGNDAGDTWITPSMIQAYQELFEEGFAHSVEVWQECNETRIDPCHTIATSENQKKNPPLASPNIAPVYRMKNQKKYKLVGGLYGVRMGHIFCGESMFYLVPEASRAALAFLIDAMKKQNMPLLDSQQKTPHIERMGGQNISRKEYLQVLQEGLYIHGTAHANPFFS